MLLIQHLSLMDEYSTTDSPGFASGFDPKKPVAEAQAQAQALEPERQRTNHRGCVRRNRVTCVWDLSRREETEWNEA